MIAYNSKFELINYDKLVELIKNSNEDYLIIISKEQQNILNYNSKVKLNDNVYISSFSKPLFLGESSPQMFVWPKIVEPLFMKGYLPSLGRLIFKAAAEAWNCNLELLYKTLSSNYEEDSPVVVGTIGTEKYIMQEGIYTIRKPNE